MAERIEYILDNCLERIFSGESREDCLKTYPEQASELESLLDTSLAFVEESAAIQPDHEFKVRTHAQLQSLLHARREKVEGKAAISIWRRRWVPAVASIVIILFAGIGTAAASANALPEQPLYPVKLATEQMMMGLAFSDVDKAELHIEFAQRRTTEMAELASQGDDDKALLLAEEADSHIDQVEEIVEARETAQAEDAELFSVPPESPPPAESAPGQVTAPSPIPAPSASQRANDNSSSDEKRALAVMLSRSRAENLAKLHNALDKAPKELKPSIEQAIKNMARDYDETLLNLES
jgi:hypothetical protein